MINRVLGPIVLYLRKRSDIAAERTTNRRMFEQVVKDYKRGVTWGHLNPTYKFILDVYTGKIKIK